MKKFLLLLILLTYHPAWAATYHVNKNGSDNNSCTTAQNNEKNAKLTIRAGVACARLPGDIVMVHTGIYAEHVNGYIHTLNSGVFNNPIIIQGAPGEVVIINQTPTSENAFTTCGHSYLTFRNFIIDNLNRVNSAGAFQIQCASVGITIEDNIIRNTWSNAIGVGNPGSRNHIIRRNKIHNIGKISEQLAGYCIYSGADYVLIEDNECYDAGSSGFHIHDNSYAFDNIIIRRNKVNNNEVLHLGAGIVATRGSKNKLTIYQNIVTNESGNCIETGAYGGSASIINNITYNCGNRHIYIHGSLENNIIENNLQ
jgi:hypothetical protein